MRVFVCARADACVYNACVCVCFLDLSGASSNRIRLRLCSSEPTVVVVGGRGLTCGNSHTFSGWISLGLSV